MENNTTQEFPVAEVKNFINKLAANKDYLYIFQPFSIGDLLYTGGLSLAVQKRKNKIATVLIVHERMKNLGVFYNNIKEIIYLSGKEIDILRNYFYITQDYEGDNYIYGHFRLSDNKSYIWDDSLHLIDRYKQSVFSIPQDTPYIKPQVADISKEDISKLNKKYKIDKNRTVILLPYTHSTKMMEKSFWEIMVNFLKQFIQMLMVFQNNPLQVLKELLQIFRS